MSARKRGSSLGQFIGTVIYDVGGVYRHTNAASECLLILLSDYLHVFVRVCVVQASASRHVAGDPVDPHLCQPSEFEQK